MSHTTLWRVFRTKATPAETFSNSWLAAPPLWDYLSKKFLGRDSWFAYGIELQQLWDLCNDERVPYHIKVTHATTMDRAIIPVKSDKILCAFIKTAKELAIPRWGEIAATIQSMVLKPRQIGWGVGCTSVSDPWGHYKGKGFFLE